MITDRSEFTTSTTTTTSMLPKRGIFEVTTTHCPSRGSRKDYKLSVNVNFSFLLEAQNSSEIYNRPLQSLETIFSDITFETTSIRITGTVKPPTFRYYKPEEKQVLTDNANDLNPRDQSLTKRKAQELGTHINFENQTKSLLKLKN